MAAALFNPGDLDTYRKLQAQIADFQQHQVKENSSAAHVQVQELHAALQKEQARLQQIKTAQAQAEEQVAKYSKGWYLGKHIGDHEKKKTEADSTLAEVQSRAAAVSARIAEAQAKLRSAQELDAAWGAKLREMQAAEKQQADLVEAMFAQPHWNNDANLAAAAAAVADLQRQAAESAGNGGVYQRAEGLLSSAMQKVEGALQAMSRVQMMSGAELMMVRRNPMGMNMMEMATIRRSNDMVQSAAQDIASARSVLPTIPWINDAVLDSARKGVFISILFGGFMGDMAQFAMVKKAVGEIQEMRACVKQSLEWVVNNARAFQGAAQAVQAQIAAKEAEVRAFKTGKLQEALAAGTAS